MSSSSSSTSAFVASLIFNSIIALIFTFLFVRFRPKHTRFYEPRTLKDVQTIREEERPEPVPDGYFKWVPYLLSKPHSYLIQHVSIDGYLFLRYLGIFTCVGFLSWFILFPILLPVNATNGNNLKGFELLSMANVTNKNRFYAHVFLSWIWFGLLIFIIYKELYYYVIFRHSLQTTPLYDGLLSSRTIILTELGSGKFGRKGELDMVFTKATNISFAMNHEDLTAICKERLKNSRKFESALNKVISKSVKLKLKADKDEDFKKKLYNDGKSQIDDLETYVPFGKRPSHRIDYKIPFFKWSGKRVNTIQYLNEKIPEQTEEVHTLQDNSINDDILPTAFIKFDTQLEAQRNYQSIDELIGKESYGYKYIGFSEEDIIYSNLRLKPKERFSRNLTANTFLTCLLIFWAIPVAAVGCISNISFLTEKIHFLGFINNLPNVLLGLITGILPTVALAYLMSLVPPIIIKVSHLSGAVNKQKVDLYCQSWYYAFQVIQVFIVMTLSSSASATVTAIINDPSSAMTLLANNLPKASNFYISYFLLLGLTVPAGSLLQVIHLVVSKVARFLDSTPRQKWKRYNVLTKPTMGIIYPAIEIIVCISICYSIIAPLVLVFSTMALFFLYIAYIYNLNYVFGFSIDMKGRNYPRALFQVFVGIYLSEVCLLGLFIMIKSWGCVVLEAVFLAFTALCHIYFKRKFIPLFDTVPLSAIRYARGEPGYVYPSHDLGFSEIKAIGEAVRKKHEENETGGKIRPATKSEFQNAHLLPESSNQSELSESASSNVNSNERTQELNKNTENQTVVDKNAENANGSDNIATDDEKMATVVKESETLGAGSSRRPSTFVSEDEKFRKYHYEDVEDLKMYPTTTSTERKPGEGSVLGHGDAGNIYSDQLAMTNDPKAYPKNLNKTHNWKERIINFFHPSRAYPFEKVRMRLPHVLNTTIDYNHEFIKYAYTEPCVTEKDPIIWVPNDPMGVSEQQIAEAKNHGLNVCSQFTCFDDKGRAGFTFNPPDYVHEIKK